MSYDQGKEGKCRQKGPMTRESSEKVGTGMPFFLFCRISYILKKLEFLYKIV